MIDVNAYIGNWVFRPLPNTSPKGLSDCLMANGIQKAFVSSIEAIFYDEPHLANEILFSQIDDFPNFLPVPVINPNLANWDKKLNKYHKLHKIKAIKLHPNYHLYKLNDNNVRELLISAGEKNITVIIQMRIQDVRSQNPICVVQDVDISSVIETAETIKETRFIFGGIKWNEVQVMADRIKALCNVWIDISNIEYVNVLRRLINVFGTNRILFGTHSPFFEVKSAILKLKEASLTKEEFESITILNTKKAFSLL